MAEGLRRIIIGYSKKAILADTFGAQIARIDGVLLAGGVDTPTMWLRALLYFFQLYYDFSGYSDIAIGLCRVFGFSIKENFNFPYISTSITEFWRRWHISLGSWFREYVYFPLGGNRRGNVYLNLFVVFLLTGIFPLVPGAGIYYTAYYFIQSNNALALSNGISTFKIAVVLATGIALVLGIPLPHRRRRARVFSFIRIYTFIFIPFLHKCLQIGFNLTEFLPNP